MMIALWCQSCILGHCLSHKKVRRGQQCRGMKSGKSGAGTGFKLSQSEVTFNNLLRFKGRFESTQFFWLCVYAQVCVCIFGSVMTEIMAVWLFADGECHTNTRTTTFSPFDDKSLCQSKANYYQVSVFLQNWYYDSSPSPIRFLCFDILCHSCPFIIYLWIRHCSSNPSPSLSLCLLLRMCGWAAECQLFGLCLHCPSS